MRKLILLLLLGLLVGCNMPEPKRIKVLHISSYKEGFYLEKYSNEIIKNEILNFQVIDETENNYKVASYTYLWIPKNPEEKLISETQVFSLWEDGDRVKEGKLTTKGTGEDLIRDLRDMGKGKR